MSTTSDDDYQVNVLTVLVPKIFTVGLTGMASIPLCPTVWIGSMIFGRPPIMVHLDQVWRYLKYVWTIVPPPPTYPSPLARRLWLTLSILEHLFVSRFRGAAWLLDDLLYSKKLNSISIENPLFVISAGRSGSTQISRYLEEDPGIIAPNILMCMFPYLWLWRLVPYTIGRFVTKNQVREMIAQTMPKESVERHEMDPFRMDTFDAAFLSCHMNFLSLYLGPEVAKTALSFCDFDERDRSLFEKDFVRFVDRLGQKTMFYNHGTCSPPPSSSSARFFLKGHFLQCAPALAKYYPQSNFLTVVRDPLQRLQSSINFLRCNPADPFLGPVPWEWFTETLSETESRYCDVEMEWYSHTKEDDDDETSRSNRFVVSFERFVKDDLRQTMARIYKECMNDKQVPESIPKEHPPRDRTNYSVNRSLEDLGVDQDALRIRLSKYIDWISKL